MRWPATWQKLQLPFSTVATIGASYGHMLIRTESGKVTGASE